MNIAAHFAQMLKCFARIMVNFSALGMQLHPHAIRLCLWEYVFLLRLSSEFSASLKRKDIHAVASFHNSSTQFLHLCGVLILVVF